LIWEEDDYDDCDDKSIGEDLDKEQSLSLHSTKGKIHSKNTTDVSASYETVI